MHKFRSILILALLLTACAPIVTPVAPTSTVEPVGTTPTVELTETPILWATNTPTQTDAEKAANTPTVIPPTVTPTATPGIQPPACTFPLAQTTMENSKPEKYTFSEPRVVFADPNAGFNIIEWLPNNQQALIVRDIIENQYLQYQSIDLFNSNTAKLQIYAKRKPTYSESPVWMAGLNAIIYPERSLVSYSRDNRGMIIQSSVVDRELLWLNYGDNNTQALEDIQLKLSSAPHEWIISSLAAKPGGNQIAYLKNNGQDFLLYSRETSQGSLKPEKLSLLDLSHWNYRQDARLQPFKMAWRPNSSQIFLYTDWDWSVGYTFLVDIDTGQVCELNLNGWAILGRWSPDGRYLAVVRARGHDLIHDTTDFAVIDTVIGNLYAMAVVPKEAPGRHDVGDIAWAPDNHHLLVNGRTSAFPQCAQDCWQDTKLYLADFLTGQVDNLFPSNQFISNNPGNNLAWSPDGSKVLTYCRVPKAGLCLISVRSAGQ